MSIHLALTWILFLALFPITFFWLRRAYRIIFKNDFSEVALKKGEPPVEAEKFAPYTAGVNLISGVVLLAVIFLIIFQGLDYETWTAIVGSTIWIKFFIDYIISRHAHPIWDKNKKQ